MSQNNYLVNDSIQVEYKAEKAKTGLTVQMDVYDETLTLDVMQSVSMVEVGSTGVYTASFIPTEIGSWVVSCYESGKPQTKIINKYEVGNYNTESIGDAVSALDVKLDTIQSEVENLASPPQIA